MFATDTSGNVSERSLEPSQTQTGSGAVALSSSCWQQFSTTPKAFWAELASEETHLIYSTHTQSVRQLCVTLRGWVSEEAALDDVSSDGSSQSFSLLLLSLLHHPAKLFIQACKHTAPSAAASDLFFGLLFDASRKEVWDLTFFTPVVWRHESSEALLFQPPGDRPSAAGCWFDMVRRYDPPEESDLKVLAVNTDRVCVCVRHVYVGMDRCK